MECPFALQRMVCACCALICSISFVISSPVEVTACPPSPPTLSRLIASADLIVTGTLVRTDAPAADADPAAGFFVYARNTRSMIDAHGSVQVDGVIKGNASDVDAAAATGIRLDERALEASRALVFVSRSDDLGYYVTYWLDIADSGVEQTSVARVREMLDIQRLPEEEQRPRQIEWAIRCAEDPPLREEAVGELFHLGWQTWQFADDGEDVVDESRLLDDWQRERLTRVLIGMDMTDDLAIRLAALLMIEKTPHVLDLFEREIARHAGAPGDQTQTIMEILSRELEWQTGSTLAERFGNATEDAERLELLDLFLTLLPDRVELDLPELTAEEIDLSEEAETAYDFESELRQVADEVERALDEAVDEYERAAGGETEEEIVLIAKDGM